MVINPIVGVYIPIITIPFKGEMTIPNIGSLDPGTYWFPKLELAFFCPASILTRPQTRAGRCLFHARRHKGFGGVKRWEDQQLG